MRPPANASMRRRPPSRSARNAQISVAALRRCRVASLRRRLRLQPEDQDAEAGPLRHPRRRSARRRRPRCRSRCRGPPLEDPVLTLIAASEHISRPARKSWNTATSRRRTGVRPRGRRAARVAVRRPHRAAHPRTLRPPGRPHQHLRGTALAEGDGFTEKKYEPASIDELLAHVRDPRRRRRPPELQDAVSRPDRRASTTSRFRSTSGC